MAEAFAKTYGSDVMVPASAGLAPAGKLHRATIRAMAEKNIDIEHQYPKSLRHLSRAEFDLVVNMSNSYLPGPPAPRVLDWDVDDPVFMEYEEHCAIRDEIERRVMGLILELRRENGPKFRGHGSGRLKL
jgi:arsenate reductase (thioredoxin)